MRPVVPTLACAVAALALSSTVLVGCGEDSAEPSGPTVTVRITRNYGHELISEKRVPLREGRTLLRALRYAHDVDSYLGGRGIRSIDGMRQRWGAGEEESAWIYTINGLESEVSPAEYRLHAGDLTQWDLRPWIVTIDARAMVGGFPQMLTRGVDGTPFRVSLRCERPSSSACRHVGRVLRSEGVYIDRDASPAGPPPAGRRFPHARVLVGTWRHWRHLAWPSRLSVATDYSGLYARFADDGARLQLLDWRGRVGRVAGPGSGVVLAMSGKQGYVALLVAGTDNRGVERAARALGSPQARGAYGVAVTHDGIDKLPLPPR